MTGESRLEQETKTKVEKEKPLENGNFHGCKGLAILYGEAVRLTYLI